MSLNKLLPVLIFIWAGALHAQNPENRPIQLTGFVMTQQANKRIAVPFANIYTADRKRGDIANAKGYFSLVVLPQEVLYFSALGFTKSVYKVPEKHDHDHLHITVLLEPDTIVLSEAIIYPWPDRNHFRQDFLAMDVSDPLQARAEENLSSDRIRRLIETTSTDGDENTQLLMRQRARSYYTYGQLQPMQLLSPAAWKEFFNALKKGEFKKRE